MISCLACCNVRSCLCQLLSRLKMLVVWPNFQAQAVPSKYHGHKITHGTAVGVAMSLIVCILRWGIMRLP